jgi:predicted amidohydrolase YtcJ
LRRVAPLVSETLFRDVEVEGVVTDVRVRDGRIAEVARGLSGLGTDEVVDGRANALIPGLHDHHLHLLAAAAAAQSIRLGPPEVCNARQFAEVLTSAAAEAAAATWLRGVGYHESVAGDIDQDTLDALVPNHPLRVQHRSGARWTLNSQALRELQLDAPRGQLYGADELLRRRLSPESPPPLAPIGARLASFGVTGVTDATPSTDLASVQLLAGALPQSVMVMGGPSLASGPSVRGIRWGPVKFVVADYALPAFDDVRDAIATAHGSGRPIAIHCVTAEAIALALAAWNDVGSRDGDRIEHGAVITPEAAVRIAELEITVVTQPGFITSRGDQYRTDVEPEDREHLYRCGSLLRAGIEVGGSTDAPFGDLDPWRAIRAAIHRRTASGAALGTQERVPSDRALALFLARPERPGGPARRIESGAVADLCLLDAPLADALTSPTHEHVVATWARGQCIFRREVDNP